MHFSGIESSIACGCHSPKDIRSALDHLEAITQAPVSRDKTSLQSFFGLETYYLKFLPKLQHQLNLFESNSRQKQNLFELHSKTKLSITRSCSTQPRFCPFKNFNINLPTVVSTDASKFHLGAFLQQEHIQGLQTVPASRALSCGERNCSTGEKEALAQPWACEECICCWYIGDPINRPTTKLSQFCCLHSVLAELELKLGKHCYSPRITTSMHNNTYI